jgi:phospholipase C
MWSAYSAISRYRDNPTLWDRYIRPVDDVVRDIQKDRLPPVTWITPRFADSEHPDYNFCYGENWTTSIVDSVMRSPIWKNTAIFITWDEYGGFYDHVPPQQLDQLGLGIRVPLLVISPYSNQGQVFHQQSEFSSVLRFIEDNWGLSQLTKRDANTTNIADAFSFSSPPRPPDPLPLRTDCVGPKWAPADPSHT